ncbi:hypothetical protein SISNIDRAFT_471089 [Sistotremastrum niveocremeum HHB9708]|uniref:Uncharacterized protein n=1 Tax=Sistotremastrum niveocremeum HHB9708 TaxID=1314777 RepID=A0A164N484_9AGAM|nr:hypothetical protein SISNIDRAFT_471089 [Sistotremastrum niveocremeum HHB9708]
MSKHDWILWNERTKMAMVSVTHVRYSVMGRSMRYLLPKTGEKKSAGLSAFNFSGIVGSINSDAMAEARPWLPQGRFGSKSSLPGTGPSRGSGPTATAIADVGSDKEKEEESRRRVSDEDEGVPMRRYQKIARSSSYEEDSLPETGSDVDQAVKVHVMPSELKRSDKLRRLSRTKLAHPEGRSSMTPKSNEEISHCDGIIRELGVLFVDAWELNGDQHETTARQSMTYTESYLLALEVTEIVLIQQRLDCWREIVDVRQRDANLTIRAEEVDWVFRGEQRGAGILPPGMDCTVKVKETELEGPCQRVHDSECAGR